MHSAITLEALRVIEAIKEQGSFAAAAESLFKVPSALTYQVQKLESDLGIALFDRSGQRSKLTAAGQMVLEEGREILLAARRLEDRVKQIESGWETHLTIAKDTILPDKPLMQLLGHLCEHGKQIEIKIIEEALAGGWDALHTQRADIAIGVTGDLPKGQYELHHMGEMEFVFAVAANHPLADFQGVLPAEIIRDYPAIIVSDSTRHLPERSGGLFHNKQSIRVPNMSAKLEAQLQGIGIGYLPLHIAKPYLLSGQLEAKATSSHKRSLPIYLAHSKHKTGKGLAWLKEACLAQNWFE